MVSSTGLIPLIEGLEHNTVKQKLRTMGSIEMANRHERLSRKASRVLDISSKQ
jgi:hypothetical protein